MSETLVSLRDSLVGGIKVALAASRSGGQTSNMTTLRVRDASFSDLTPLTFSTADATPLDEGRFKFGDFAYDEIDSHAFKNVGPSGLFAIGARHWITTAPDGEQSNFEPANEALTIRMRHRRRNFAMSDRKLHGSTPELVYLANDDQFAFAYLSEDNPGASNVHVGSIVGEDLNLMLFTRLTTDPDFQDLFLDG